MKFVILVAVVTGVYVCVMDIANKFTSSIDFGNSNNLTVVEVSIKGEVESPGTYYLPSGATLKDLVAYAGGFSENANVSNLSASEVLIDGKTYTIPSSESEVINPININTASISELQKVSGIGKTLAARIVAYRVENGKFNSLEELCNVKGIKEATLEKIEPYLTVE